MTSKYRQPLNRSKRRADGRAHWREIEIICTTARTRFGDGSPFYARDLRRILSDFYGIDVSVMMVAQTIKRFLDVDIIRDNGQQYILRVC